MSRAAVGLKEGAEQVPAIIRREHNTVEFQGPVGAGNSAAVVLRLVDRGGSELEVALASDVAYAAPKIQALVPSIMSVGDPNNAVVVSAAGAETQISRPPAVTRRLEDAVPGLRMGTITAHMSGIGVASNDAFGWDATPKGVSVRLSGSNATHAFRLNADPNSDSVSVGVPVLPAGTHYLELSAVGYNIIGSVDSTGLIVACKAGFYGFPGELCAPCPPGADC